MAWPDFLPAPVLGSVRSAAPVGAVLETEMQSGRVKRRGRSAAVIAPLSFVVAPVTGAQVEAFEAWIREDLGGGVKTFAMAHPVTGAAIRARFPASDGYSVEELARDAFSLSVALEVRS